MVQVKDLKEQVGILGSRPILYCGICGNEFSANAGDYWNAKPDHVFRCCGANIILVIKKTIRRVVMA